jgi:hypothetical protein
MNEKFLVIKVAQLAVSYPKSEKNRIVGGVLNLEFLILTLLIFWFNLIASFFFGLAKCLRFISNL